MVKYTALMLDALFISRYNNFKHHINIKYIEMISLDIIKANKIEILSIAEKCNAENVRIFGSLARGTPRKNSDVDFLVHMKPGSGFCLGGLKWRLEELLKCKVDIIPDTSLHPLIRDTILKEAINL
jgi:predicted nucleotidyltransferase